MCFCLCCAVRTAPGCRPARRRTSAGPPAAGAPRTPPPPDGVCRASAGPVSTARSSSRSLTPQHATTILFWTGKKHLPSVARPSYYSRLASPEGGPSHHGTHQPTHPPAHITSRLREGHHSPPTHLAGPPNSLVDLEVVVGRQLRDRRLQLGVLQNVVRDPPRLPHEALSVGRLGWGWDGLGVG